MTMAYETYTWSAQPFGAYLLNRYLRDPSLHLFYNALPARVTLWHDEALVVAGNALTFAINANQFHRFYSWQDPAALNDSWTQSLVLLPGTYEIKLFYFTGPNSGKLDLDLGSHQIVSSLDLYTAAPTFNQYAPYIWTVITGGLYTLTGTVIGKNAASGGYEARLTYIAFYSEQLAGGDL
jgi:hypothetical protein